MNSGERTRQFASLHLPNDVPPAFRFDPVISGAARSQQSESAPVRLRRGAWHSARNHGQRRSRKIWRSWPSPRFVSLERLLQSKKVSVVELTEMYLARLKRFNPQLAFSRDADRRAREGASRRT